MKQRDEQFNTINDNRKEAHFVQDLTCHLTLNNLVIYVLVLLATVPHKIQFGFYLEALNYTARRNRNMVFIREWDLWKITRHFSQLTKCTKTRVELTAVAHA